MTSGRPSSTSPPARGTATFLLREPRQVQGFREPLVEGAALTDGPALTDGSALTMIWIPPGRFWMGSPETEPQRADAEGPRHLVQLPGFFMGQTPITQAQWRAVARWQPPKGRGWERELDPEPSRFHAEREMKQVLDRRYGTFALLEGETTTDQRPVEGVSWHDAMEFCRRLNSRLGAGAGGGYALPSEAQWEYACRAGTSTPFAFGETLTPELANYDGNHTYANGPKGKNRKQTTPVGLFPANAWGLHDMHGNVWEWCLDHWNESYGGAPGDGSAWMNVEEGEANDKRSVKRGKKTSLESNMSRVHRLLRGGSWYHGPENCRSAYRNRGTPEDVLINVGFRMVYLPQSPSLNP